MNFPTSIANNTGMLIDSFFLDIMKFNIITAYKFENGPSDHDSPSTKNAPKKKVTLINDQTLNNFVSVMRRNMGQFTT